MGLKKLAAKVSDYHDRLESGKVSKIKPHHVETVLAKLRAKEETLKADLGKVSSDDKKQRLQHKLEIAQEHIARAQYLLTEIARNAGASKGE